MLTGFIIRPAEQGCYLAYISQTDPKGKLPSWLINKLTQKMAPKTVRKLEKAAEGYEAWKNSQVNPRFKPWLYPEQTLMSVRVNICDVRKVLFIITFVFFMLIHATVPVYGVNNLFYFTSDNAVVLLMYSSV